MATIYILEDDLNIQEIEAYALKNSGYQTEGFDNAREFFKKVSERVPSLLLLDIMLPDADGLDVLRKLRSIPCLLYTSPSPRDANASRMPSSA